MVNINKLKGKIVENGLTIEKLADNIGIDRSTLYRKINNKGETFTIKEADLILNALNLTAEEAKAIFFSQLVA
jgi:transcriptional regulator with XRE-family HTH domain